MPRGFRTVPSSLRRLRYGARYREYARFYGLYINRIGKRKRFSYSVRISPRLSNRRKYRYIVIVCNALLNKEIPEHRQGEVFYSFRELLHETRWVRVRRLLEYHAGVEYER